MSKKRSLGSEKITVPDEIKNFNRDVCKKLHTYIEVGPDSEKFNEFSKIWYYIFSTGDVIWGNFVGEAKKMDIDIDSFIGRQRFWKEKFKQEPYVNTKTNIEIICDLLAQVLDRVLSPQVSPKKLKEEDIDLFTLLPEELLQYIIGYIFAWPNTLSVFTISNVSKLFQHRIAHRPEYKMFKKAVFLANIASKCSSESPVKLYAMLNKSSDVQDIGMHMISFHRDGVLIKKHVLNLAKDVDSIEYIRAHMETLQYMYRMESVIELEAFFNTLYIMNNTKLAELLQIQFEDEIVSDVLEDTSDLTVVTRSIIIIWYSAIVLRDIFTYAKIDINSIDTTQQYKSNDVFTIKSVANVQGVNIVPRFIYWFLMSVPKPSHGNRDLFFINIDFLGKGGLYSNYECIPMLNSEALDRKNVGVDMHDLILPHDLLKTGYFQTAEITNVSGVPILYDKIYRVTKISMDRLDKFVETKSPWFVYERERPDFAKPGVLEKKYGLRGRNIGKLVNSEYRGTAGLYDSIQYISHVNPLRLSPNGIIGLMNMMQSDSTSDTAAIIFTVNIIFALSQDVPVWWVNITSDNMLEKVVFYKNFVFVMSNYQMLTQYTINKLIEVYQNYVFKVNETLIGNFKPIGQCKRYAALRETISNNKFGYNDQLLEFLETFKYVVDFDPLNYARGMKEFIAYLCFTHVSTYFRLYLPLLNLDDQYTNGKLQLVGQEESGQTYYFYPDARVFSSAHTVSAYNNSIKIVHTTLISAKQTYELLIGKYGDEIPENILLETKPLTEYKSISGMESPNSMLHFLTHFVSKNFVAYTFSREEVEKYMANDSRHEKEADNDTEYWEKQIENGILPKKVSGENQPIDTIQLLNDSTRYWIPSGAVILANKIDELFSILPARIVVDYKGKLYRDTPTRLLI